MPLLPFPFALGSDKHPSQDVNNQNRMNVYTSPAGNFGRGDSQAANFVIMPTSGLGLLDAVGGSMVRAVIVAENDHVYAVVDNTVYLITINIGALTGVATSIGTVIGSATAPISWVDNRTQVMMVNGEDNWGYLINYQTDILTQITDVDFFGGDTVTFMDTYFLYNRPGTQQMFASQINDGSSWNALDTASAESLADNLVGLVMDKRELIAFGAKSIEFWYDAANASGFPFLPRPGEYYNVGCAAKLSILSIDNTVFFLDHRRYVSSLSNDNGLVILSTPSVKAEFASYTTVSDAQAYSFEENGQLMYILNFPTEGKTWAYDLLTQHWHERAYWDGSGSYTRHRANVVTKYQQYYIAGDYANGTLYIYHKNYYTDNGQMIRRNLRIPYLHNQNLLTTINSLYLHGEFGKGLTTGQGSDPQLMLRYSKDGGYTWSNERWKTLGALGNYNQRVTFYTLGTQREWLFEFTITDPIKFSLSELGFDLEVNNV